MIDLITRVRTPRLYARMTLSAQTMADKTVRMLYETDSENLPKLAETYNRLAERSIADILCFVHDDIEFLSPGWDTVIQELFDEYDADVIGVVGSERYAGGRLFDAGPDHALGHFCCEIDGVPYVKVLSKRFRYKPAKVVDGMIMFCRKSFWEKEKFDQTFDELFFYDTDVCLRGKVGITCNVFVKHSKPKELYGVYPENLKPIGFYEQAFNKKHGFGEHEVHKPACAMATLGDFIKRGQNDIYDGFVERYGAICA